jgi:hypothetical protein
MRCPDIQPNASYVVAIAGSIGPWQVHGRVTDMALVHVRTSHTVASAPVTKAEVVETGVDYFDLRVQSQEAGQVYYAVAYSSVQATFFQSHILTFEQADMPAWQVVEQGVSVNGSLKQDGIVAAGVINVQTENEWTTQRIQPACMSRSCRVRENFRNSQLSPATEYTIFMVYGSPLQDPASAILVGAAIAPLNDGCQA